MTIAVIGSGVVGTATGLGFQLKGHKIVFCDVSSERLAFLGEQGLDAVAPANLSQISADLYLIGVQTPFVGGGVDLSPICDAAETVGRCLQTHPGHPTVVVRSTVPPGTTTDVIKPIIESVSGKLAGSDFGLCTNPEFLRAASAREDFLDPRVIVIGALDERSALALRQAYAAWTDVPVIETDIKTAEATKYVSNLFNATKISFYNEMHRILSMIGADASTAFSAVATGAEGMWNPSYGTRGGAPYAGRCLPKDTMGFMSFARMQGMDQLMPVLAATIQINREMEAADGSSTEMGSSGDEGILDSGIPL